MFVGATYDKEETSEPARSSTTDTAYDDADEYDENSMTPGDDDAAGGDGAQSRRVQRAAAHTEANDIDAALRNYTLPPLPPVPPPSTVHNLPAADVYSIIAELRRQIDDPVERERAKTMLQSDTGVLLAVAQVLHESGVLRRATISDAGEIQEQLVPPPEVPAPPLPAGYSSWLVDRAPAPPVYYQ